jgi:hypothetical protein
MNSTHVIPEYVRYDEPRWRGRFPSFQGEWRVICSIEIFYAFPTLYFPRSIEDVLDGLRSAKVYKLYDGTFSYGFFHQSNVRSFLEFDCTFDSETLISILRVVNPGIKLTRRFGHCEITNGNYLGPLPQLLDNNN